jgi:hypothetical protein
MSDDGQAVDLPSVAHAGRSGSGVQDRRKILARHTDGQLSLCRSAKHPDICGRARALEGVRGCGDGQAARC